MQGNNNKPSFASLARGIIGLWTVLVLGLGLMARPAAAAPFAYVTNFGDSKTRHDIVSVIDTATNTVVATVPVGIMLRGVAVTPNGTHVYVTVQYSDTVAVIDAQFGTTNVFTILPLSDLEDRYLNYYGGPMEMPESYVA